MSSLGTNEKTLSHLKMKLHHDAVECVCLSSVALNVSAPASGSFCLTLPEFLQEHLCGVQTPPSNRRNLRMQERV